MSPRFARLAKWLAALFCLTIILPILGDFGLIDTAVNIVRPLLLGWIAYIGRISHTVHVNWNLTSLTAILFLTLVAGTHAFVGWFTREVQRPDVFTWRLDWTIKIFVLLLLSFVPAMALIGITHQTIWLSKAPFFKHSYSTLKCSANLHNIGIALMTYANTYEGHYPDNLRVLAEKEELGPKIFICPDSSDTVASDSDADAIRDLLKPGHCSYIYLGEGLRSPVDPNRIVVIEPPEHHGGKLLHILYGDGHIGFVNLPEHENILLERGFERVEPPKAQEVSP